MAQYPKKRYEVVGMEFANSGEVVNYFGTIVYLLIVYVNMLKSIHCSEVTLIDFVYA